MNALTACNNCEAAEMVDGDPRGYCVECITETDGPAIGETTEVGKAAETFEIVKMEVDYDRIEAQPRAHVWFASDDDARRFIAQDDSVRWRRPILDFYTVTGEVRVCVEVTWS